MVNTLFLFQSEVIQKLPTIDAKSVTEDNWYVGMKVKRGKDWPNETIAINGIGMIHHRAYLRAPFNTCTIKKTQSALRDYTNISSSWVMVTWPGRKEYCHRIGAGGKYDLFMHVEGNILNLRIYPNVWEKHLTVRFFQNFGV